MCRRITLNIPGKCIGKQRPKFSRQGNFVRTYTPEKTVSYENFVRYLFMQTGEEKISGPIRATIYAFFKIPSSVSKKKHKEMLFAPYTHKPDADNIAKSILDGLSGIAYDDDSQITELRVEKFYSDDEYAFLILEEKTRYTQLCENCKYYNRDNEKHECTVDVPFYDSEHFLDGSNEFACKFWKAVQDD